MTSMVLLSALISHVTDPFPPSLLDDARSDTKQSMGRVLDVEWYDLNVNAVEHIPPSKNCA